MDTKRKSVLKVNREAGAIVFTVLGFPPERLTIGALNDTVQEEALFNGLIQTVVDSAALSRDENGRPATPAEKHSAIKARLDTIRSGVWTLGGAIYKAVSMVTGKSPAEARAWFDSRSADEQRSVRGTKRIVEALTTLRGSGGNAAGDELLNQLL